MSETERLKEVIQQNESRIAELTKSIEAVVYSFSEESKTILETAEKIDVQLQEADRRIATHDESIAKLEEKKQSLRSIINSSEQQVKELERKISSLTSENSSTSKELLRTEDTLKQYKAKMETVKLESEKLESAINEVETGIEKTRASNEKEFQERRAGFEEAQKKIKELVEREPVAEFLLTEATQEPAEISIIAGLVKGDGVASIEELKKATKVPPALAVRTILSLEQKGIIAREGSDKVRLTKTLT
ncbi:MAG: hypothetical protein WED04_11370 [Promethearchaeati archaeon SRVP18_Atabeyarchaeia-1]